MPLTEVALQIVPISRKQEAVSVKWPARESLIRDTSTDQQPD